MNPKIKKRSDISEEPLTLSPKRINFRDTAMQKQQRPGVIALLISHLKILNANLIFIYSKDNSRIYVTVGCWFCLVFLMHE